ncbi:hypothetical protein [Nocardia jiangsuensis]|uniref:Uncharacterized protein n=1 Tax=Nocardia jiangsuensis TaxID=1691563 RepID=A0ABV8E037_9NOCA
MWDDVAGQVFDAGCYDPGLYGHDADSRWRSAEGAAAWIRQCLTQVSAAGLVAVPLPVAAVAGEQARALRGELLRGGVLRALVTGLDADRDLWVLAAGERVDEVLLLDAAGDVGRVAKVWRAFRADPADPLPAPHVVRGIDRLADRIDLTPPTPVQQCPYPALRARLLDRPDPGLPQLAPIEPPGAVTLGELVEAEMVAVRQSPPAVAMGGDAPMWTAKDVRLGRAPSRAGDAAAPGAVTARAGDVAVLVPEGVARVCREEGVLLGPGIELLRADPSVLDPEFLAGVLRAAVEDAGGVDLYAVPVPRLTPAEQRRYAAAFVRLRALEAEWLRYRDELDQLVRAGFRGLAAGRLRPAEEPR